MDTPRMINVSQLRKHPKNPRIAIREDVVEGIAESIRDGGFQPEYALIVRPMEGYYQILSGHHRYEAARRAEIETVPCWVRDMNDDTAYMALVTSNTQGELTPLEIGLHALERVEKAQGKRGGGLTEYARLIGKSQPTISKFRSAAEVFRELHSTLNEVDRLIDKPIHLSEIHAARHDEKHDLWPVLAEALLEKDWSVKDTHYYVEQVARFEIPEEWEFFLPLEKVVEKYLATKEFAPTTVNQLWETTAATEEMIRGFNIDTDTAITDYRKWLVTEPRPWDVRALKKRHDELKNQLEAEERFAAYSLGDWRDHIVKLKDGTVKLLLTDPPYGIEYLSDYKLDRREERNHKQIKQDTPEDAIRELSECMSACFPKLQEDAHVFCFCHWSNEHGIRKALEDCGLKIRGSLIWEKNNTGMGDPKTTFAPKHERIIHAVKGSPILYERKPDVLHADRCDSKNHPTEKPVLLLTELIEASTARGDVVLDPFAGVASTLVAAKNSERGYFGCEIEEKYHEIGRKRL